MENYQRNREDYTTAPWYQYHDLIQNITVANGITNISDNAFALTSVKNITLPDSVKTIGTAGFYFCQNLSSVQLPKNLETIGVIAFTYSGLASVDIPETVSNIGTYAFATSSLQSITLPENTALVQSIFWEGGDAHPDNGFKIYCKGNVTVCEEKIKAMDAPAAASNQNMPFNYGIRVYRTNKRIYTVEEANADSKKNGNTIKIRYR